MNLKLTHIELKSFMLAIAYESKDVRFNTHIESKLCKELINDFVMSTIKKSSPPKPKYTLKIDKPTMLALNIVLPQIYPANDYDLSVMTRIIKEVNQACLSI